MPRATDHHTPSRRVFIGATTIGLLAGGPVAALATTHAEHPDAELIALCAEYVQNEVTYAHTCWADDRPDNWPGKLQARADFRAAEARRHELGNAIVKAVPVTIEGYRAKARAVAADFGDSYEPDGIGGEVLWSMVTSLLEGEG